MWVSVCVSEQAAEPCSLWFLLTFYTSRSVAPHPYWGSPQRCGHFLSTVVWMCIIPSTQWTYVECKCVQTFAQPTKQVWMQIYTGCLLALRKHYIFAEAFIFYIWFCYRVTVRFCFLKKLTIDLFIWKLLNGTLLFVRLYFFFQICWFWSTAASAGFQHFSKLKFIIL